MSVRATLLVVEREVREAARRKANWALVGLVAAGATAMVVLPSVVGGDGSTDIAIVGPDRLELADAVGDEFAVVDLADGVAPAIAVEDGEVAIAVVYGDETSPPSLLVRDAGDREVAVLAEIVSGRSVRERLSESGIDADEVASAFAAAAPSIETVDADRDGRRGVAFGLTLVLYLVTVVLTSQVAGSVSVEKANRVSEVLLAIVPPRSLLFGKVIGVGCIGMVTIIAGATPVVVRLLVGDGVVDGVGTTLLASSAWFFGGLALYLLLAGALGALVARQEEIGAVITPLTMLLVAGYIAALSFADSDVGAVLALVPLLSPMIEPYRIAIGAGSWPEYVASLTILLGSVVVAGRVGSTMFRRAIVRTGRRLGVREALRSPR